MKLKSTIKHLLTNPLVLKVVAFLAFFNVIGYLVMGNINVALYFIVFAVLIRYFSRNMTIVLGIPLIIVNLLAMKGNILEGMENKNTSSETKNSKNANSNTNSNTNSSKQEMIDKLVNKQKNKPTQKSEQGLPMQPLEDSETISDNAAQSSSGEQQGFEPGRRKNRHNIDYATTVEDAYDELNNILGSDGIQKLTSDTQNLMKQQMKLAEAMKSMGPMMQSLAPMVESLKGMMSDGKQGLGGIMDLAKKMSPPQQ